MFMSFNKKRLMRTLLTTNRGCGCSKLKPSDVLDPTPIPKISIYQHTNPSSIISSTTTSGDRTDVDDEGQHTSTTISEDHHEYHNNNKHSIPKPNKKLVNSIAVEKESEDPHEDFRNSMLQMILEREIYSETDLQELLECFLKLNAPCHHQVIVQAFMEICEETFPKKLHNGGGGGGEAARRNNHQINGKKESVNVAINSSRSAMWRH